MKIISWGYLGKPVPIDKLNLRLWTKFMEVSDIISSDTNSERMSNEGSLKCIPYRRNKET